MDDFVQVTITRAASLQDRLRAYRILLDGQEVGKISANGVLKIPASPGRHTLQAKVDWCGSPPIEVDFQAGSSPIFECGSNLLGWRIFLAFYYVFIKRDEYLWLRGIE